MSVRVGPRTAGSPQLRSGSGPYRRRLWQVPTFVLGLLALAGVAVARPLWHETEEGRLGHTLTVLRQALDESPAELQQAIRQVESALDRLELYPRRAGEAHFLLGSGYVRLAEAAAEPPPLPFEAPAAPVRGDVESWQKARDHLQQAEALTVADSDRSRLTYLLGKTWQNLGEDPQRVIASLAGSVDSADDRAEGYGLLAEAYLRLPAPDLRAALAANEKQLATPSLDDRILARGRLLRAELLLKLEEAEEARKVLRRILDRAACTPPAIRTRARAMLARCYQEDAAWADALPLWEEARTDSHTPAAERARVLFYQGQCYRKLGQSAEAARTWELARQGGGEEGQAASLALGEMRLHGAEPGTALEAFAAALGNVTTPADYHNTLIELAAARSIFERACRRCREGGAYELAQQLAQLYEKLAVPGKGQELFAEAADAWARATLAHAVPDAQGQIPEADRVAALGHFREAAAAYEAAAGLTQNPAEQGDWLWRSADRYLQARDPEQAVLVLQRFVKLSVVSPERLGEAWFLLGEAHRAAQHGLAAQTAYLKCLEYACPSAFQARYHLAVAEIEHGNLDEAEAHLQQNLQLMEATPDSTAHEKTLFTLADLLYHRHEYRMAEVRLQEALERYPGNARALQARFQLAICCRKLGEQDGQRLELDDRATMEVRSHYSMQRHRWLEMAAINYLKIGDDLIERQSKSPLNAEEEALLRLALFGVADCRFLQGQYEESRRLYAGLADRYPRQIDTLIALRNTWDCCKLIGKPEQVREAYNRVLTAYREVDPAVFDGKTPVRTRAYWEDFLKKSR